MTLDEYQAEQNRTGNGSSLIVFVLGLGGAGLGGRER